MLGWPGEPAPCTKRKERATPQRQRQRTGVSALHNPWRPGARPSFFKGGIPRLSPAWYCLVTRAAASFIECTDDPHPFCEVREKDWATG